MNKIKGFTLIELLVAISILVILMMIGIMVFTNVSKNARDQKRIRDLQTISQALEMFRGDVHYYPSSQSAALIFNGKTYLDSWPKDPSSGASYFYTAYAASCDNFTTFCTSFCLEARVENTANKNDYTSCNGNPNDYYQTGPR